MNCGTRRRISDYWVTVCDACLTATCWHGEFMCQRARTASTTTRAASELDALGREHPDRYSRETLRRVTGRPPEEIR